jgi:hypothetical protein
MEFQHRNGNYIQKQIENLEHKYTRDTSETEEHKEKKGERNNEQRFKYLWNHTKYIS